jgi:hypothetical protein
LFLSILNLLLFAFYTLLSCGELINFTAFVSGIYLYRAWRETFKYHGNEFQTLSGDNAFYVPSSGLHPDTGQ